MDKVTRAFIERGIRRVDVRHLVHRLNGESDSYWMTRDGEIFFASCHSIIAHAICIDLRFPHKRKSPVDVLIAKGCVRIQLAPNQFAYEYTIPLTPAQRHAILPLTRGREVHEFRRP